MAFVGGDEVIARSVAEVGPRQRGGSPARRLIIDQPLRQLAQVAREPGALRDFERSRPSALYSSRMRAKVSIPLLEVMGSAWSSETVPTGGGAFPYSARAGSPTAAPHPAADAGTPPCRAWSEHQRRAQDDPVGARIGGLQDSGRAARATPPPAGTTHRLAWAPQHRPPLAARISCIASREATSSTTIRPLSL